MPVPLTPAQKVPPKRLFHLLVGILHDVVVAHCVRQTRGAQTQAQPQTQCKRTRGHTDKDTQTHLRAWQNENSMLRGQESQKPLGWRLWELPVGASKFCFEQVAASWMLMHFASSFRAHYTPLTLPFEAFVLLCAWSLDVEYPLEFYLFWPPKVASCCWPGPKELDLDFCSSPRWIRSHVLDEELRRSRFFQFHRLSEGIELGMPVIGR